MSTDSQMLIPVPSSWWGGGFVANYGDPVSEYRALGESAGIVDLSARGKILFTGPDRQSWLQGQVSNDVLNLPAGAGCEAGVLEVKGHILSFLRIYNPGEYLLADVNPDICANTINRLDFYRIMEKVELRNATADWGLVGVYGPGSRRVLEHVFEGEYLDLASEYDCREVPAPASDQPALRLRSGPSANQPFDSAQGLRPTSPSTPLRAFGQLTNQPTNQPANLRQKCLIVRSLVAGDEGYEIYASHEVMREIVWPGCLSAGARPCGLEAVNIRRIEQVRPWQPFELNENIFPHEARIETRAVSFTKGCYLGQEVVARIHSRGGVRRLLSFLRFSGTSLPAAGAPISGRQAAKEVGFVTSAANSPANGLIGLGYVRREALESQDMLYCESAEGAISVAAGPGLEKQ